MRERAGWLRRHRVALATNLALLAATGSIVAYAVSADGFETHEAELNDGGIWVTNSEDGLYGRINKPIDQADAAMLAEQDQNLDIVQQGAAVVGINHSEHLLIAIDPATVRPVEGSEAVLPADARVLMAGGTLAVLDPAKGRVWAVPVEPDAGSPQIAPVAESSKPVATIGKAAAMTVTDSGTVVAASAETDRLVEIRPVGDGFRAGKPRAAGVELSDGISMTAVGERIVVLDPETGDLDVIGGGSAALAPGGVLQQAGPAGSTVLVGGADELLEVALDTGEVTPVAKGLSGRPTEPVRLGACAYGAWSGGRGAVVTVCGDGAAEPQPLVAEAADVVFRVNRGQILLNDRPSGAVWNVDDDKPVRIDEWEPFLSDTVKDDEKDEKDNKDRGDRQPPKAKPDDLGARPGRLTVLYPLDNDTAPPGRILAIREVRNVSGAGIVTIGPDGQTLQIALPDGAVGPTTFEYYIDDGRAGTEAHARVSVATRDLPVNDEPRPRPGYKPRSWVVGAGGTLDIPVLPDWRDPSDGDPLSLASATAVGGDRSGASARTTATGRLRFAAPPQEGVAQIEYAVTDGVGEPVTESISVRVLARTARDTFAPVAEPDIVTGEVGEVIGIEPLGNDLPGADPLSPEAGLELAGKVAQIGGADVRTDLVNGSITFKSKTARTYFLDYDAAYGTAPISAGRIRVDVQPKQDPPPPPVAMPDQVTLFGQSSTNVDVLANDVDPAGGMLVVQRAEALSDNELDVAVVDGRWIRVSARQGELSANPQVIRYTISNGHASGVEGEITVSQRDAVDDDTPVTTVDRVTVRAGAAVTVPVLDNDFSPSGGQLSLVSDVAGEASGGLTVRGDGAAGSAYVAGRTVRYVAPSGLDDATDFGIRYIATNDDGMTAPGRIEVTVVPAKRRNQAPTPPLLEGRTVAGDLVTLRLPGAGVDPDGDAVTLLGLASGPALGRVVKYGANSLQYQAFPGQKGTDEFNYRVVDSYGEMAEGTVRVAVVPGDMPQPPLPVADKVTVEAGRSVRVDAMANDLVADGDHARMELVDPPEGVTLAGELGPVNVATSGAQAGETVRIVYRLTNGVDTNQTTVSVRVVDGYNNPPVAFDAFGTARDSDSVTVDVLETAYDPDGAEGDLEVTEVFTPVGVPAARVANGKITLARGDQPAVVPFRVTDGDGGVASASVFVPARGRNLPYVRANAVLRLDPGERLQARLEDYVVNPSGGPVSITVSDRVRVSPGEGLSVAARGKNGFTVEAGDKMAGPGAVMVEVTTGTSVNDPDGLVAMLTIPVQVGRTRPIVNCPSAPIEVPAGEQVSVTVLSHCHVWTEDPADAASLSFTGEWEQPAPGLDLAEDDGPVLTVAAASSADQDAEGTLRIGAEGSLPADLRFVVTGGPPPSLTPIDVDDLTAGESVTVDLAPYLQPGIDDATPTLLEVRALDNPGVRAERVSDTGLRLTASDQANGQAVFAIEMSDVPRSQARANRRVEGRLTVRILGRPDTPASPVPGNVQRSQEVPVSWRAPANNGSPIDRYEVRTNPGGITRTCASTSCDVGGLTNGTTYQFSVRASNAAGWSDWSPWSRGATPDSLPGQVGPISMIRPGDHVLKIAWGKPRGSATIDHYVVAFGGQRREFTGTTATITGLDNNVAYRFTISAVNKVGNGPPRTSAPMQSQGPIGRPAAPNVDDPPGAPDTANLVISWPPVPPNGPGPVFYRVLHNGVAIPGCDGIQAASCTLTGIPYDGGRHTFQVGVNVEGEVPIYGPEREYFAVGRPDPWSAWQLDPTGQDGQARASFTVPESRGKESRVAILVDGQVVKQLDARSGGRSETLSLGQNAQAYSVQLSLCNETDRCSQSAAQSVTPYGPLRQSDLVAVNAEVNGRDIRWRVTVNSEGDPAYVSVEGNSGRRDTVRSGSPGAVDLYTPWRTIGYSSTETVRVTLADDSPARGPVSVEQTSPSTVDPPPFGVSVSRGAACSDAAGSPNLCGSVPPCTEASCAYARVTWTNLVGRNGFCTAFATDANGNSDPLDSFQLGAQPDYGQTSEHITTRGARGGRVWVDCGDLGTAETSW